MFDIQIINADITQLDVDSIVCPIHSNLTPAFPVGERIWETAGHEQMRQACQRFTVKPSPAAVRTSITASGFRGNIQYVWNAKWREKPATEWYVRGISLTRKDPSVAIPVLIPWEQQDGIQIGTLWRKILQRIFQIEPHMPNNRRIFLVAENELVCQIGQLVLHEELAAREKKLSEKALLNEQQKAEYLLAKSIDREKLAEYILQLYEIREIQWVPPKQMEDGVWQFGYPVYPKGIFPILHLMEPDYQYSDHLKQMKKQKLRFSELSLSQIQTYLTYLHRGERFCDGLIAEAVNHGTLLKLLLRIHDLINPYPW